MLVWMERHTPVRFRRHCIVQFTSLYIWKPRLIQRCKVDERIEKSNIRVIISSVSSYDDNHFYRLAAAAEDHQESLRKPLHFHQDRVGTALKTRSKDRFITNLINWLHTDPGNR
eukprot:GILK01012311.1.p3 GENE.GILK01012311.1~~GILK01012311.1.p3  ORF type:complete len:114 (-),score=8.86 GILK01012311.1:474-815(-)